MRGAAAGNVHEDRGRRVYTLIIDSVTRGERIVSTDDHEVRAGAEVRPDHEVGDPDSGWPQLSELDLGVCLSTSPARADGGAEEPRARVDGASQRR